ncbi:hypothetical protein [Kordiimonas pumila]|uniref:Uncharacterized protein n=1 Tax=Kordiimonas pumila TaxID=2161677 RepID=A0ABV7D880_9PROT|nr:hypothetical protein [Kordiimonas pumila]
MTDTDSTSTLMQLYAEMDTATPIDSPFQKYTHHFWQWRYKEAVSSIVSPLDMGGAAIEPKALIAAYRTAIAVSDPAQAFTETLATQLEPKIRFEVLLAAYNVLPQKTFFRLLKQEDTAAHSISVYRNVLASLEFFLHTKLEHDTAAAQVLRRWNASSIYTSLFELLENKQLLHTDPEQFVEKLAQLGHDIEHPFIPFFEPIKLVHSIKGYKKYARTSLHRKYSLPVRLENLHAPMENEPVFLVNADKVYFEKYAKTFLESCGKCAKNTIVHINFINFAVPSAEIKQLEKDCRVRINTSQETFDGALIEMKSYAVFSRYIHLPHWLQAYPYLVILDIDGKAIFDPKELALIGPGSIALNRPEHAGLHQETFIWKVYHGGRAVFHAPATSTVNNLSCFVEDVFYRSIRDKTRSWYLDQLALMLMALSEPKLEVQKAPALFDQIKKR